MVFAQVHRETIPADSRSNSVCYHVFFATKYSFATEYPLLPKPWMPEGASLIVKAARAVARVDLSDIRLSEKPSDSSAHSHSVNRGTMFNTGSVAIHMS